MHLTQLDRTKSCVKNQFLKYFVHSCASGCSVLFRWMDKWLATLSNISTEHDQAETSSVVLVWFFQFSFSLVLVETSDLCLVLA